MKKILKNKKLMCIIVLVIAVLAVGTIIFLSTRKKNSNEKENEVETKPVVSESKLKVIDLESDSRPVAVMVNNLNAARPYQSGLQDAYIVYEIIVEGGITRMMAVYKDADTARIGSVRSSRHYYLDYALENDAIYVHFGWSTQAQSDIPTLGINNINGLYDSAFWREDLPVDYEHTAFTSMEKITNVAKNKGYRLTSTKDTLLNYSVEEVDLSKDSNAKVANSIDIKYSNYLTDVYNYNSEDKLYYRNVNGKAHVDYETKKQYTAKNIIVAFVDNDDITNDEKGRQELHNIGTGNGYYITDGYAIPIKWNKSGRSSQTIYKDLEGKEIDVNDGNTFIQITPLNSTMINE